ncbi:DUF4249 domain-containing protein [Hymenobacter yonginensis]|uniref:DUF4249 domain-containing protein n=1 Tax=Hymenobacter yonginensis TaxID=748197 RepID=A0ABY7PMF0_9BACT|nr:DUF4249 domain-containing protein [Hymenobacter yonginensis]WBO84381.1 DUF4249 domain-containing protein [Hymenobacter yonginensis]
MRAILPLLARLSLLWSLLLGSCIEPYLPEDIGSTRSFLVVDGFINLSGPTTIRLSRTYDVKAGGQPPAELRAALYIEAENGQRYPLAEGADGVYTAAPLPLVAGNLYRLHITTAAGLMYASEFVQAKATPPIDSVTWRPSADGLTVYVNAHDDTRATQYYRWEFQETWEIKPLLVPTVAYINRSMRPIVTPYPELCWASQLSTPIRLSKTTALTQDVVADYPLISISTTSQRLLRKYSILVKQYAQTPQEYQYWEQLQKNTENIGTLFDPLPSQLTGNVKCLNDGQELALGYVGAHGISEQRLFIDRDQLPRAWRPLTGYEDCIPPDTVELPAIHNVFGGNKVVPVRAVYTTGGALRGYTSATKDCVDCRLRGTSVRPSFWQ